MNDTWDSADIDQAKRDLVAAGWTEKTSVIWKSPSGSLHVGPAGAWKTMQRAKNDQRYRSGWCVRVSVFDDLVVSISERELCGRDISEADADLIRLCAQHLLSFVGKKRRDQPLAVNAVDPDAGDCADQPPREGKSS